MSSSSRISKCPSLFFILIIGIELFKCVKSEATYQYESRNFGLDFLGGISVLNENGILDVMVSKICSNELKILENALKENNLEALQFADAWAKMPNGILYGHTIEFGNFDECLNSSTEFNSSVRIEGKYCLSDLKVTETEQQTNLKLGICIPKACNAMEIQLLLNQYLNQKRNSISYNASLLEGNCYTKNRESFKTLDWVALGVLIVLGLLLILSTSYDYCSRKKEDKIIYLLCTAFSIRKNMSQLVQITPIADTPKHVVPAIHGIRSLSTIWIIFLHITILSFKQPNINSVEIDQWQTTPFHMIFKNGTYAVDTFFFLSGLLIVWVAFREMEKKSGKLNIPLMYFHRFIRLSPVLYLGVLIRMTLFRFIDSGPMWNALLGPNLCEDSWWATLIYVQNYAAATNMCFGHSWYLAVDTQLYIISPFVIILIWRWRRWGLATLIFIGLFLAVCLFCIIIIYDIAVFDLEKVPRAENISNLMTYYPTHARASPWIIGMIFGYYLHACKGRRIVVSKMVLISGWIISLGLFLVVIFALYPKTQYNAQIITPLEGAFYLPLSRIAWPLGLCWLIFACVNGYAGPVNDFLSCVLWQPISKLSYCMYIFHYMVITLSAIRIRTNTHFSTYDVILHFWSDFGITLILSTVVHLAIEAPMLGIEKCLLAKKAPKWRGEKEPEIKISEQNICDKNFKA